MRIYSIEFDEYEKAALLTAIENDEDRLKKLHDRVYLADSQKVVPHPSESFTVDERLTRPLANASEIAPGKPEPVTPPPRAG